MTTCLIRRTRIREWCARALAQTLAVLLMTGATFVQAEPEFASRDLDVMIDQAAPVHPGTVELLPMHRVQVIATVAALPAPRKTFYLMKALGMWGVTALPEVSNGIDIESPQGRRLNVYIEDNVARQATESLTVGERVTLYGYHVYDSKHGPGILVSGFDRHTGAADGVGVRDAVLTSPSE